MLTVLHGENDFEKRQALAALVVDAEPERYDGETLTLEVLRELCIGQTLFASERTIIVYGLSDNDELWPQLPEVLHDATSTVILVEGKLDKRTKAYKFLQKHATVREFVPLSDHDMARAVQWCVERSKSAYGAPLAQVVAQALVERAGMDMGRLDGFLEQLALADGVTEQTIEMLVPLPKTESVFALFEAVLSQKSERVSEIIRYLEMENGSDGAYQTLGLLISQLAPLNALVLGASADADTAKRLGTHPFVVQKLRHYARSLALTDIRQINHTLATVDAQMKSTTISPWVILEAGLMKLIGTR